MEDCKIEHDIIDVGFESWTDYGPKGSEYHVKRSYPDGTQTEKWYEYDSRGNCTRFWDDTGYCETYWYDSEGICTRKKTSYGGNEHLYELDSGGNCIRELDNSDET